jgi:hypothetical protein
MKKAEELLYQGFLEEAKLIAVNSTLHLLLMIIVRYRIRTFGNLL